MRRSSALEPGHLLSHAPTAHTIAAAVRVAARRLPRVEVHPQSSSALWKLAKQCPLLFVATPSCTPCVVHFTDRRLEVVKRRVDNRGPGC
ncbi:hypothetical protein AURDEDRAFT_111688 [Auricularia subglabra TFB-10046 SS5]|nr:hypothetical protein AURDEDRAFT_111688 [Auricularia subglabra TFB-10046 SS5]